MQKKNLRLVLSGGGSGGHLTPSLAVAQEFLKEVPGGEVYFFISQTPLDESVIAPSGFSYKKIYTGKLRRYFSWKNISDFFLFIAGIFQSLYWLKKLHIDVVFSKGGFVALPVAIAAWFLRIPIVAHESDTVQGLANRMIARFAKKLCVTFPEKNYIHTGTPIRSEVIGASAKKGKEFLAFDQEKPIILFMGASQGALQINQVCDALLGELTKIANVVLVAGKGKLLQTQCSGFKQYEYLSEQFPHVLAAADIVVSRAGANSLFELAALKKASLIIPLASSAGDHQRKNAKYFEGKLAIQYFEPELNDQELAQKLFFTINEWIEFPERRKNFEENIGELFIEDAAGRIVKELLIAK